MKFDCDFSSNSPLELVRVALAIETLAYYDKNYLDVNIKNNDKISEEIQALLIEAIKRMDV